MKLVSTPELYVRLRKLMEDPNSNIEDFIEAVSGNPGLASSILKVVNGPFFGFPVQIDNISNAVNLLGIGQLYDLVLSNSEVGVLEMHGNQAHLPVLASITAGKRWA